MPGPGDGLPGSTASQPITAAQPMSASRRVSIGYWLVYSTTKRSSTNRTAALTNSIASCSKACLSAMTSSLTHAVPSASRASRAVAGPRRR